MDSLPQSTEQATQFVWWASLAIGVVVSVVVALLLWLINRAVVAIDVRVSRIWDTGQRIANNTVHIPTLNKISEVVGQILSAASRNDAAAAAIESHAKGCPGCPQCMWAH
jgi:hypothetical protein